MTKHGQPEPTDDLRHAGRFYRCLDAERCGLRFPVVVGDTFRGVCPRCGGPVQLVAQVAAAGVSLSPEAPAIAPGAISVLLDNWRSVFNVGAAFRTADGAGVRHLYLCGITATPATQRKLAKTALGAEAAVAWSYHADSIRLAERMRAAGTQVWVLEHAADSQSLFDINVAAEIGPVVLAAGNELAGVDPGLVALADRVVHLPMVGIKQSLNVAVALSVACYWLQAPALATDGAALAGQ